MLGADRGYDVRSFVAGRRGLSVTPHASQTGNMGISGRATGTGAIRSRCSIT